MKVIDRLLKAVRSAAVFNPDVQVAPACILWPDADRQWEKIISRLQAELPEIFILGDYQPEKRIGPAIWLRCVIAGKITDVMPATTSTPILYLPGVSRQDLRAVENCPEHIKPLAELQYRGVIWSQINAKDWTVLAFLQTDKGGLALDVATDNETKSAMQISLYRLLDEDLEPLKNKRLDKDYFNTLLIDGDPARKFLEWLNLGEEFQNSRDENEWQGFVGACKSIYKFDPQTDGFLSAAARLATQNEDAWKPLWQRFCEAPNRYPNIPPQIRKCSPPQHELFWQLPNGLNDGWPQWNDEQEQKLHQSLESLANLPAHEVRAQLLELETQHSRRRQLVWSELGQAPLAMAIEYLAIMADITKNHKLAAGTPLELAETYQKQGWLADDALIQSLSLVVKTQDIEAITIAIRSIYLPWAEESARYLQKVVYETSYPGHPEPSSKPHTYQDGDCIMFVDGLRFDVAKRLVKILADKGFDILEVPQWVALPSVTATGKAAVTPVKDKIQGQDDNVDFEPCVAETGKSLKGGYHLKKLLKDNNWQILERSDNGNGQGLAWCEFGDIDGEGHNYGLKLAQRIDILLKEIHERIELLLAAGWKSVRVVTDHGWLLLPGGLPKMELSSNLTDSKWGRCAAIKPGVFNSNVKLFPWFWNVNQYFALADGISCFRNGEEYTHGGLSLQECLTLEITVSKGTMTNSYAVEITDVVWKGLRCKVVVDGSVSGLFVDIRTKPGDSSSSVVVGQKPLKDDGTASVVVENDDLEGTAATLVLLDISGVLIAQIPTTIGGGSK